MSTPAFAAPLSLSSTANNLTLAASTTHTRSLRCSAAPERTKVSKVSLPTQNYRVLPEHLPLSERPPPPPTHKSIPFIGFFLENALGKFSDGLASLHQRYGPIYYSNFFLAPIFYIQSYNETCEMLKDTTTFASKDAFPGGMQELFGADVVTVLDGKDHEIARASLTPAFSPALFPYYLKDVVKRTNETWGKVEETVKKDGSVLFDPIFREHYLSITIEMTTGIECGSEKMSHLRNLFADFTDSLFLPNFTPGWRRGIAARDEVRSILREVILDKIANRADTINQLRAYGNDIIKIGTKDISGGNVDILLVSIANSSLSTEKNAPVDEELISSLGRSMILLWFAGYVTSASTSGSGTFELGFREDILTRLVEEQDAIGEEEITYEQVVSKMPLLDGYLNEVLRLYPAVTIMLRRTTADVEILGKFVPAGSRLILSIPELQKSEEFYTNANELNPERWTGRKKPTALLAFGVPGTPHYCLGAGFAKLMMKVTFASLLRNYKYELDPEQSRKYRTFPEMTTPESGVRVNSFKRRNRSSED